MECGGVVKKLLIGILVLLGVVVLLAGGYVGYLMLDYNCPRAVLERASAITPGLESPTIAPLAEPDWVAVRALVPRRGVNAIMDDLLAIGAQAILASEIRFCRF